jgi:hypothetical protein
LEICLEFTCDRAVDVILKGGKRRQSLQLGPGHHRIRTAYTVGEPVEDVGYEINVVRGEKTDIRVASLSAAPLVLNGEPAVQCESLNPQGGFVRVRAKNSGRVIFCLPFHKRWRAEVDGEPADVVSGISGTTAVPVPAGEHFVALRCS